MIWPPAEQLAVTPTTNQATQFARSVPDFALNGRFADLVKPTSARWRPPGRWRRLPRR